LEFGTKELMHPATISPSIIVLLEIKFFDCDLAHVTLPRDNMSQLMQRTTPNKFTPSFSPLPIHSPRL